MQLQRILLTSVLALAVHPILAQDHGGRAAGLLDRIRDAERSVTQDRQTLTGTWMMELRGPGDRPNRPLLVTFHDSGTATASSSSGTESPHAGVWIRVANRKFLQTMFIFVYNPQNALAAINKVRITAQLDDTGNTVRGTAEIVVTDPAGQLITTVRGVEYSGVRLAVERSADAEDFIRDNHRN
jgi:hypothetical protein